MLSLNHPAPPTFLQGLLTTLIRAPYDAIGVDTWAGMGAASLQLAAELDLATIMGELEDGVSVKELSEKAGIGQSRLGTIYTVYTYTMHAYAFPRTSVALFGDAGMVS